MKTHKNHRLQAVLAWPAPALFFAALLLIQAAFKYYIFLDCGGLLPFSGESAARMTTAWQWTRDISFGVHPSWLPLPFWLTGIGFLVVRDLALATALLNGLLGLAALWLLARTTLLVFRGNIYVCMAALAAAALNLEHILQTMYASSDPVFWCAVMAGVYYTMRWWESDRQLDLYAAAAGFGLSSLARYEGWLFCAVFFFACLYKKRKWSAALTFLPAAAWLGYQAFSFGNPLHFLEVGSVTNFDHPSGFPNWQNLKVMATFFFSDPPYVGWGVLLVSGAAFHRPLRGPYLAFAGLPLLVFAAASFMFSTPAIRYHLVAFQLLLCPLWGYAFFLLISARKAPVQLAYLCGLVVFTSVLSWQQWRFLRQDTYFEKDGRAVTALIQGLAAANWFGDGAFLAEVPDNLPSPELSLRSNFIMAWAAAALPHRTFFDRDLNYRRAAARGRFLDKSSNPSALDLPDDWLREWLQSRGVRLVIAQNKSGLDAMDAMDNWERSGSMGPYRIYTRQGDRLGAAVRAGAARPTR